MTDTPLPQTTLPIAWVSRLHDSWYDYEAARAVAGYVLRFKWLPTGSILEVKLPDASYTADGVARVILAAGNADNAVHGLAQSNG